MGKLTELAERCEKAAVGGVAETKALLESADALASTKMIDDAAYRKFVKLLNAGAYLDAAMTLVRDGLRRLLDEQREYWAVSLWADKFTPVAEGKAATPALALCAAALRARTPEHPR